MLIEASSWKTPQILDMFSESLHIIVLKSDYIDEHVNPVNELSTRMTKWADAQSLAPGLPVCVTKREAFFVSRIEAIQFLKAKLLWLLLLVKTFFSIHYD